MTKIYQWILVLVFFNALQSARAQVPYAELHFDIDDTLVYLLTKNYLYHKKTGAELAISGFDLGKHYRTIGISGPYADYEIRNGSYRESGSAKITVEGHIASVPIDGQFLEAIYENTEWQGPAFELFVEMLWREFQHGDVDVATLTARGVLREELMSAFGLYVSVGVIPKIPDFRNYAMAKNPFQNPGIALAHNVFKGVELAKRLDALRERVKTHQIDYRPALIFLDDSPGNISTANHFLADEAKKSRGNRWKDIDIYTIQVAKEGPSEIFRIAPGTIQPHAECIYLLNGLTITPTLNRQGKRFL